MASPPLIDFREIDLSHTLYGKEAVREVIQQRGQFEMIDGVQLLCEERQLVVGYKDIRADDWWAPFHIPGRPLFPGALMIEAAAQLSSFCYQRFYSPEGHFVGFGGIDKARFRAAVEPDCRLVIACQLVRGRKTMFMSQAQGFVNEQRVFEAEILGVLL